MSEKQNIGGVQSWSVGEVYPYHVVVVGSGRVGDGGTVFAQGPSGKLMEHHFTSMGQGGDFKAAHADAMANARYQLMLDAPHPPALDGSDATGERFPGKRPAWACLRQAV